MARTSMRLARGVAVALCVALLGAAPALGEDAQPEPASGSGRTRSSAAKLPSQRSQAYRPMSRRVLTGRYLVEVANPADRDQILDDYAGQIRPTGRFGAAVAGFAAQLDAATASELRKDPRVRTVEQDELLRMFATQAWPAWGLDRIDQARRPLDKTYSYARSGKGVTAYVLDSGLYRGHNEFEDRAARGFDATGTGSTADCNGHGTHVAGTIAGRRYGVAKGTTVVPVRVLGCGDYIRKSHLLAGLDYVARSHRTGIPAVANMSLGSPPSSTIDRAVTRLINEGVTVVAAAGNSSMDACYVSPARVGRVITVGAVDSTDTAPFWSNFGPCLDIFAPGVGVVSAGTSSRSATAIYDGTSMAAPHVTGAVARLLSRTPSATPATIAARLKDDATRGLVKYPGQDTTRRLLYLRGQRPTRLGMSLSTDAIHRGDSLKIRGTLRNAVSDVPIAGQRIVVRSRRVGTRTWERVGVRTTNSIGQFALVQAPTRSVEYSIRHAGSGTTRPDSSGTDRVTVDPRVRTVLSVTGLASSVEAGAAVSMSAALRRTSGSALSGKILRLYARPASSATWTVVQTKTTNAEGRATFLHAPVHTTDYQVRHPGTSSTLAATTAPRTVGVAFAIVSSLDAATVAAGATVRATGSVTPVPTNGFADLQVSSDGGTTWQLVEAVTLDGAGAFDTAFSAPSSGVYEYRLRVASDTWNVQGVSQEQHLTVSGG